MSLDRTLRIIQVAYPQVYLACHTRHQRRRSTELRLSARDSSLLAHLDPARPIAPTELAGHLGVAKSTLSEALKRLERLGFVIRKHRRGTEGRRGGVGILLSERGSAAIRDTSVLEEPRLRTVLGRLTRAELAVVGRGMRTLAAACHRR